MIKLINATGHTVRVRQTDGDVKVHPPSSIYLRLTGADVRDWSAKDVEIVQRRFYHKPSNLPEVQEDVMYIVSRKFACAYANLRDDLVYPDTEDGAERDGCGRVLAVRRFRRPDKLEM